MNRQANQQRSRLTARTGAISTATQKNAVHISRAKRNVHVTFEALGVFVVAPFGIWLAMNKDLPDWARQLSGVIAGTTLVVDGGLLISYLGEKKRNRGTPA